MREKKFLQKEVELNFFLTAERLVGRIPSLPPQARCTHPNEKSECVYFFSVEYFGIKVDLDGKKKKQPGVQAKVYSKSY